MLGHIVEVAVAAIVLLAENARHTHVAVTGYVFDLAIGAHYAGFPESFQLGNSWTLAMPTQYSSWLCRQRQGFSSR